MAYPRFEWTVDHLQQCLASAELVDAAFATADADGDGIVSPMEAPPFFRPSGLPEHVLSNIWRLSAPQNALRSPGELRIALRMAYDALQGKPLPDVERQPSASLNAAARAGSGAAGLPPMQQPPAASGTQRTGPLSLEDMDAQIARFKTPEAVAADVTPPEASKYDAHFERAKQGGSWVELSQARDYFSRANLQDAAIQRVLQFVCGSDKAMLGRGDFFVVTHLVYTAHRDRNLPAAPPAGSALQSRAFSLTPSRLSAASSDQIPSANSGSLAAITTQSFPESGGPGLHRRGASADFPSAAGMGPSDPRIQALEQELQRQQARLQEAQELQAEAREVDDAELVEEATQAVQRIEAGVKQRETELARLKAPPQPAGSVAQAMSLRERLKKLQAAEAQRSAGSGPMATQPSGVSEAAGTSDDDFTFSPVQGASPAGTPRSGPISPRFGSLTRQLSDTADQVGGRHRRNRSASGNMEGFLRPSRPAPRAPSAPVPGPGEQQPVSTSEAGAPGGQEPSPASRAATAPAAALPGAWATFGDGAPAAAADSDATGPPDEAPTLPSAPHMPPESAGGDEPAAAAGAASEAHDAAAEAQPDAARAMPSSVHLPPESAGAAEPVAEAAPATANAEAAEAQPSETRAMPSAPHLPPESAGAAEPVAEAAPATADAEAAEAQPEEARAMPSVAHLPPESAGAAEPVADAAPAAASSAEAASSASAQESDARAMPSAPHLPPESASAAESVAEAAPAAASAEEAQAQPEEARAMPSAAHLPPESAGAAEPVAEAAPATADAEEAQAQPQETPAVPSAPHLPPESAGAADPVAHAAAAEASPADAEPPADGQPSEERAMASAPHLPPESAGSADPVAAADTTSDREASSAAANEQPAAAAAASEANEHSGKNGSLPGADTGAGQVSPEEPGGNGAVGAATTEGTGSAESEGADMIEDASPMLPHTPPESAAPASGVAAEGAAASPEGAPTTEPSSGAAAPLETSASVADAADATMLGEDIPIPETIAEGSADAAEVGSTAATPASPETPQRPAVLHSVPVSQPQGALPLGMVHAHSRALSLAEAGGVSSSNYDLEATAAIDTPAAASAADAGMPSGEAGPPPEQLAEADASTARDFSTASMGLVNGSSNGPAMPDAAELTPALREAPVGDSAAQWAARGTLEQSPASLPGVLENGQADADSAAAAALPDGAEVQDAVTEAAQPGPPPPTAQRTAAEPATGAAPQSYRSLKAPSATDLVEIHGTATLASNGSAVGGGVAAFPVPGPPPPVDAPATSGADTAAAASSGAGWATFGESSSPSAQLTSAAGGANMSKGFGSFEQFAQLQEPPPPPKRVPYVTYQPTPPVSAARPSFEVPVSVAEAVLPPGEQQPVMAPPTAVSVPSNLDAFSAPMQAAQSTPSPPTSEAPAPGSTAAARQWPNARSPPPLPPPPAEDVFGALLPAEFLMARRTSPPTSPAAPAGASPNAAGTTLGEGAAAAAPASGTSAVAAISADGLPDDGPAANPGGSGGGGARDALQLPDPDAAEAAPEGEEAGSNGATSEPPAAGAASEAALAPADPIAAQQTQQAPASEAASLPEAPSIASVGAGAAPADAAQSPPEQLQPLVPQPSPSAEPPQDATSNPFQDFSSSTAAPEPQPSVPSATPPEWSSFGSPAAPQLQMQPYGSGAAQPQPPMPSWGAPLQLEAPPPPNSSQGQGAPASGADWFDFGGGPPTAASEPAGGSSTALVPVGGRFMASSGFTPGGQTAPAGWASFDDAAFPAPSTAAATTPAGSFPGNDFGGGSAPQQQAARALLQISAPADAAAQGRNVLHSDSFNIASVLSPSASSAMPDLLSDRPPSPVAEFGMPADIGGEPDLSSYTPLKVEDHQRCGMAYTMKGYGDRGGAGHEEAWQLWGKAGLTDAFPQAWALADVDRDNRLNAQEFAVFMWLLKSAKKGLPVPPAPLSARQLRQFTGYSGKSSSGRLEYQQSISFGDSSEKVAAAAAAAQRAMQEQELAELVSLGFEEADAKAALEANDWNLQPAASALLARREQEAAVVAAQADYLRTPSGKLKPIAVPRHSPGASPSRTPDRSPHRRMSATGLLRRASNAAATATGGAVGNRHSRQPSAGSADGAVPIAAEGPAGSGGSQPRTPRAESGSPTAADAAGITAGATAVAVTGEGALLSVKVERVRVVYKKALDRPFCTLSLLSSDGTQLEPPSDTPPGGFDRSSYVISLDHELRLATPIASIPADANVVVEIKHWKSKEKRFSVLAWSFLPAHVLITRGDAAGNGSAAAPPTVNAGPCALPLFAKPMDPTAKKNKPLGAGAPDLHLSIGVVQP